MCGLAGLVITKPELLNIELAKAMFTMLMIENDDRGGHSWGAWGNNLAPVRGLKKFRNTNDDFHNAVRDLTYKPGLNFLFGHTRYGTHGEKNLSNAHPFEVNGLTLAHNGVVTVDGYGDKEHPVDSGRIAMAIVDHGWQQGMAKVSGMCSLLVSVGDCPMIYRHDQVLHYAKFDWGTMISSTRADLDLVANAYFGLQNVDIKEAERDVFYQPGWGDIYQPAPAKAPAPLYKSEPGKVIGFARHWSEDTPSYQGKPLYPSSYHSSSYERRYEGLDLDDEALEVVPEPPASVVTRTPRDKYISPFSKLDEVKHFEFCECCGKDLPTEDLWYVDTEWAQNFILCLDCIGDEAETGQMFTVFGKLSDITTAMLGRMKGAYDV